MKSSVEDPRLANKYLIICSFLHLYALLAVATTTTGTVSIEYTPGYLAQRDCVQSALWSGRNAGAESNNIVDWLGCTNHLDSCFCRTDLASSASSLLTSGINSFCSSDTTDVASGIAVYNSYCSRTGPATVDTVVTTSGSDSSTATITATQTVYTSSASNTSPQSSSSPTSSEAGLTLSHSSTFLDSTIIPTSGTSSSGSEGLSQSDRINLGIGLGVGLGIGLLTCFLSLVLIVMKLRKKKQKRKAEDEVEQPVIPNNA